MGLLLPSDVEGDPVNYFLASANDLFDNAIQNVSNSDMVEINIQNQVKQNNKLVGISFKQKDQLCGEVLWSVFEKFSGDI